MLGGFLTAKDAKHAKMKNREGNRSQHNALPFALFASFAVYIGSGMAGAPAPCPSNRESRSPRLAKICRVASPRFNV